MFKKMDADGSGAIDLEEFEQLTQELGGGESWSREELEEAFKAVDIGATFY